MARRSPAPKPTPIRPPKELAPWRCPHCGRRLMDLVLAPGSVVRIKCASCNAMVTKAA